MLLTVVRHLEPVPIVDGTDPIDDLTRPLSTEGSNTATALRDNVREAANGVRHGSRGIAWGPYGTSYVSPYVRCRQTAAALTPEMSSTSTWYEVPELRESAHAPQVSHVRNKMLVNEESVFELRDRVARFMGMIHGSVFPVLVVTHGDVVNAFRWVVEGLTFAQYIELYDDPSNFVPFGVAWTFDTNARMAYRRLLNSTEPDMVRRIQNTFSHGDNSYRLVPADLELR